MKDLIKSAGLNRQTFESRLRAQISTDLEKMGYSDHEVNLALQKHKNHHQR